MSDAAPLTGRAGRVSSEEDDAPREQQHERTSVERAQGALYLMLGTSLMLVSSVTVKTLDTDPLAQLSIRFVVTFVLSLVVVA